MWCFVNFRKKTFDRKLNLGGRPPHIHTTNEKKLNILKVSLKHFEKKHLISI